MALKIFDSIKPQIIDPEFGFEPEPSFRKIVKGYYISHGNSSAKASKLTEKYLTQWQAKFLDLLVESLNDKAIPTNEEEPQQVPLR